MLFALKKLTSNSGRAQSRSQCVHQMFAKWFGLISSLSNIQLKLFALYSSIFGELIGVFDLSFPNDLQMLGLKTKQSHPFVRIKFASPRLHSIRTNGIIPCVRSPSSTVNLLSECVTQLPVGGGGGCVCACVHMWCHSSRWWWWWWWLNMSQSTVCRMSECLKWHSRLCALRRMTYDSERRGKRRAFGSYACICRQLNMAMAEILVAKANK